MSPLATIKISQAQQYRNNRYLLPVFDTFLKTLVSIVSSIWYRYRPIPTACCVILFVFDWKHMWQIEADEYESDC